MSKVKLKVTREDKSGAKQSFILIDDRVLPFENSDEINIFAETGTHHLHVVCVGPRGASTTAKIESAKGKVIEPLTALIDNDLGMSHSTDQFQVTA